MLAAVIFLTHVIALFGGAICFYVSMFTKDKDGEIQNWLVSLWILVETLSEERGSRVTALLNGAASTITALLNTIFGCRLLSFRFVVTSAILSIASLYSMTALRFAFAKETLAAVSCAESVILCLLVANLVLAWPRRGVIAGAAVFAILWVYWREHGLASSLRNAYAGITIGIVLDWCFVWSSRLILRRVSHGRTLVQTLLPALLNTIIGLILLAPSALFVYFRLWYLLPHSITHSSHSIGIVEWIVAVASATNLVAGICALSLLGVVVAALFHKLFWPLVSQLVHVCYERRVIERRMFFFTAGITLLTYSFGWLSRLVKVINLLHH